MASQVLSGSSNVSYTNNTGQNVRIVINYMKSATSGASSNISMSWAGVSVSADLSIIGRNLAFAQINASSTIIANNAFSPGGAAGGLPTELMLASGQTFSATGINAYNIVVIPEAG